MFNDGKSQPHTVHVSREILLHLVELFEDKFPFFRGNAVSVVGKRDPKGGKRKKSLSNYWDIA